MNLKRRMKIMNLWKQYLKALILRTTRSKRRWQLINSLARLVSGTNRKWKKLIRRTIIRLKKKYTE